jgi:phosphoribosyl-ATP pyrophosphohydrolase/phosphoribosyl-AMP cyclohydrolase/histidinol dehydrogenase
MCEDPIPELRVLQQGEISQEDFEPVDAKVREQTLSIVEDVQRNKEDALLKYAWRFKELPEGERKFRLTRDELKEAFEALPREQQGVLERTASRIRKFAEAQRASITPTEVPIAGGFAGQTVEPVKRAGCYAPGGRYPLPSSVLMTACTARTAGVPEVVVCSPNPSPVTKGAAYVAGADCLLAIGGAHAVAAMAYGVGVPPCDMIVGPGNQYVTAAKSIVSGFCGIDMLAGPSEVLVIADATADPAIVAADLLAQAEHDVQARPILVTPDAAVVKAVNACLREQLAVLPTGDVAREAVKKGFAVITRDIAEAVEVSNSLGPEHLEIQTADSQEVANSCKSFGGLFIGKFAAEVLGDYGAGPNHVLPTSCTAKYTGGLSVHTFLRLRTWMRIDDAVAAQDQIKDSIALARLEGLEGHARAAEKRLLPENGSAAGKRHKSSD